MSEIHRLALFLEDLEPSTVLDAGQTTGTLNLLQIGMATAFGLGTSSHTVNEAEVEDALRCLKVAYGSRKPGVSVLSASVIRSHDHVPIAALFVNLLLDAVTTESVSVALSCSAVDRVADIGAAIGGSSSRRIFPGAASKLMSCALKSLRRRGTAAVPFSRAVGRVACACIDAVVRFSFLTLEDEDEWTAAAIPRFGSLAEPLLRTLLNVVVEAMHGDPMHPDAAADSNTENVLRNLCNFAMVAARDESGAACTAAVELLLALGATGAHLGVRAVVDDLRRAFTDPSVVAGAAPRKHLEPVLLSVLGGGGNGLVSPLDADRRLFLLAGAVHVAAHDCRCVVLRRHIATLKICAVATTNSKVLATGWFAVTPVVAAQVRSVMFFIAGIDPDHDAPRLKVCCEKLGDLLRSAGLRLLDNWEDYQAHPGFFIAVSLSLTHLRAMVGSGDLQRLENVFVFGGLWNAVWDCTGRTRHIWAVEDRWDECSSEQKRHRVRALACALQCVAIGASGCALCTSGDSDAQRVWLMQVVPRLIRLCASPCGDETVSQASTAALQHIASALYPSMPQRGRAAYLLTRCADSIVDDLLVTLTSMDPLVTSSYIKGQYRAVDSDSDEDTAEPSDGLNVDGACRILDVFLRICADAMSGTQDEGNTPRMSHREMCDIAERLHPFVVATVSKLITNLKRHPRPFLWKPLNAAALFVLRAQEAYDDTMAELHGLPALCHSRDRDGSPLDTSELNYDRSLPPWLAALHDVMRQAVDASLPHISEGQLSMRFAGIDFAATAVCAVSSRLGPRPLVDAADDTPHVRGPVFPTRKLSDNYLPYAHRVHLALLRCLESVSASSPHERAAAALEPCRVAEHLVSLMAPRDTPWSAAEEVQARRTLAAITSLPLLDEHVAIACIRACTRILSVAPSFLADRVARQFAPLSLLHYARYCLTVDRGALMGSAIACQEGLLRAVSRRHDSLQLATRGAGGRPSSLRGQRLAGALAELVAALQKAEQGETNAVGNTTMQSIKIIQRVVIHDDGLA